MSTFSITPVDAFCSEVMRSKESALKYLSTLADNAIKACEEYETARERYCDLCRDLGDTENLPPPLKATK